MPAPRALADLHALARRHARRAEEADDLLQSALLIALESGRADLSAPDNRRWLAGVIRNRALMDARSIARRHRRETRWALEADTANAQSDDAPHDRSSRRKSGSRATRADDRPGFRLSPERADGDGSTAEDAHTLSALPPSLRLTALLAFNGCTKAEIGWLLNLSDAALRQRLSQLRRALKAAGASQAECLSDPPTIPLASHLPFGRIRRALLAPARRGGAFLASHDPDGHLFVVSAASGAHKPFSRGNTHASNDTGDRHARRLQDRQHRPLCR